MNNVVSSTTFYGTREKKRETENQMRMFFSRLGLYLFFFLVGATSSFKSSRRFESRKIKLMIFT